MTDIFSNEAVFGFGLSIALAFAAYRSRSNGQRSSDWKLPAGASAVALVVSILLLA